MDGRWRDERRELIQVARGNAPADLVLRNARLADELVDGRHLSTAILRPNAQHRAAPSAPVRSAPTRLQRTVCADAGGHVLLI